MGEIAGTVGRWEQAKFLLHMSQGLIVAVALIGFTRDRFLELVPPALDVAYLVRLLSIVLLGVVLALPRSGEMDTAQVGTPRHYTDRDAVG